MSALAILIGCFSLSLGQAKPPANVPNPAPSGSSSANPASSNRGAGELAPAVPKPFLTPEIHERYIGPGDGPPELLAPVKEIHDKRVRLVPEVKVESVPQHIPGKAEFGTTRQDVRIQYREEKQTVTTMKLRTVERQVQVLSRRTILKGELDPTTGEPSPDCHQVSVPVTVTMSCQVLEPVTEEIIVRIPEAKTIESPIVVRRYGLLSGEQGQVAKRYRAVLFDDPIAVPPCLEDLSPRDPLGRPESPDETGASRPVIRPGPASEFPQPLPNQTFPKPIRENQPEGRDSRPPNATQSLPKPQ